MTSKLDKRCIGADELIEIIGRLLKERCKKPYSKFTEREAVFLAELILDRPNDLILFHIADYFAENYQEGVRVFANGASFRRLDFYKHFILSRGNATKSAIQAGYSPKSAKQQGHRLLRWIQNLTWQDTGKDTLVSGFKGHQK